MSLIDIFLVIICGVAIFASISLYLCGSNFISKTKKGKLILENQQLKETNKLLQEEVQKWKDLALENNIKATQGYNTIYGFPIINSFSQMQVNDIKVSKILRKKNNGFKSKRYGDKFEEKYEKLENYDEIIKEYDKLQELEPYYLEGYADGIADKGKDHKIKKGENNENRT
ncbi:MAG: hypothetical protein M0R51_08655 [Clostridia bacterium]|jgi:lipopolysaccharide export LptBFGC system permease protein LptF|nr:hypothetical protein [Clostridia bacterium]